jgi:hypothetical protein
LAVGPLAKQPVAPPEEPGVRDAVAAEAAARGEVALRRVAVVALDGGAVAAVVPAAAEAVRVAPHVAGEQQRAVRPSAAVLSAVAWTFPLLPFAQPAPQSAARFAHAKKYLRTAWP